MFIWISMTNRLLVKVFPGIWGHGKRLHLSFSEEQLLAPVSCSGSSCRLQL